MLMSCRGVRLMKIQMPLNFAERPSSVTGESHINILLTKPLEFYIANLTAKPASLPNS